VAHDEIAVGEPARVPDREAQRTADRARMLGGVERLVFRRAVDLRERRERPARIADELDEASALERRESGGVALVLRSLFDPERGGAPRRRGRLERGGEREQRRELRLDSRAQR